MKIEDAKPIFVFDTATELAFFKVAPDWAFAIHFTFAKTDLRIGELIHLLIEEVDLDGGWLHVRNKTDLGWRIKTGQERSVPLLPEVVAVLRSVIGIRSSGPVFLREKLTGKQPKLAGAKLVLERVMVDRIAAQRGDGQVLGRRDISKIAGKLWWDLGALKADAIRNSFVRIMKKLEKPQSTCPKSWRHSFATLFQDANVDPLIRQQTLGHKPTNNNGHGMTGNYTHTRPETHKQQIEAALRKWPEVLRFALERIQATRRA